MAQALSTFNRLEQSQFEAFRRATLSKDAIFKYVAHSLIHHYSNNTEDSRPPILSECVAPGEADEISLMVTTLAKAYAQRLVRTACTGSPYRGGGPLEPADLLWAFRRRQAQGLDPGFFLSNGATTRSSSLLVASSSEAVLVGSPNNNNVVVSHAQRHFAALQAQEVYNQQVGESSSGHDAGNEETNGKAEKEKQEELITEGFD